MKDILRNGPKILLGIAAVIFLTSFVSAMIAASATTMAGELPDQPALALRLLIASATALSNSVWAFALACIIDRIDRYWGDRS